MVRAARGLRAGGLCAELAPEAGSQKFNATADPARDQKHQEVQPDEREHQQITGGWTKRARALTGNPPGAQRGAGEQEQGSGVQAGGVHREGASAGLE